MEKIYKAHPDKVKAIGTYHYPRFHEICANA